MIAFALILALVFGFVPTAWAQESGSLLPAVPKATGAPHPEGNEYWRKHHMTLMRHGRDLTVYEGDREIVGSISACFTCHAAKDDAGNVVTYASEKHFCRTCHDYVAVKVDCFMCHRSTPEGVDENNAKLSIGRGDSEWVDLANFLSSLGSLPANAKGVMEVDPAALTEENVK